MVKCKSSEALKTIFPILYGLYHSGFHPRNVPEYLFFADCFKKFASKKD